MRQPGLGSHLKAQSIGSRLFLTWLLAECRSLRGAGLQTPLLSCLLAGVPPQFLATRASPTLQRASPACTVETAPERVCGRDGNRAPTQ